MMIEEVKHCLWHAKMDDIHDDEEMSADCFKFLQEKIPGYAMIPWGHHPHQAMPLQDRRCTNIDPTYCKLQLRHFPQQYNTWAHNTLDNLSLQSEFVTTFSLDSWHLFL